MPMILLLAAMVAGLQGAPGGRTPPELWGGLRSGAYEVAFKRLSTAQGQEASVLDVWYPATGSGARMSLADYLKLATDLRGVVDGFPERPEAVRRSLASAISGTVDGVPPEALDRLLSSTMAAVRDGAPADGRFPLVLWTPRYATTVAQAVLSEYLASLGFVVAFPRPSTAARLPFELATPAAKQQELRARVQDMKLALTGLEAEPFVDAAAVGVLAWSYTGEMATLFQLDEKRVRLVAGLSTNTLGGWVYRDAQALDQLDGSRLTAAYAVLTERPDAPQPPPIALDKAAVRYYLEFPGLAHGSFNALEGYIPSLLGLKGVQRWSHSGPAGVAGYEAAAVIVSRLLAHHVRGRAPQALERVPLLTGLAREVVELRTR